MSIKSISDESVMKMASICTKPENKYQSKTNIKIKIQIFMKMISISKCPRPRNNESIKIVNNIRKTNLLRK